MRLATAAALLAVAVAAAAPARGEVADHRCIRGAASKASTIRFRASDGVRLAGHVFGSGTTGVVFAHGSGGDACEWMAYARTLSSRGLRTLTFDSRNRGRSAFPWYPKNRRLERDIAGAVALLRRQGAERVFLVGSSRGAAVCLVAAARISPPVDGVVSLSSPAYAVMNAMAFVPRLRVPVLYAAGAEEGGFARDARLLYEATNAPSKRLELIPGEFHGSDLMRLPEVRRLVGEFIGAPRGA